jgi:hypothetical protein
MRTVYTSFCVAEKDAEKNDCADERNDEARSLIALFKDLLESFSTGRGNKTGDGTWKAATS